MNVQVRMKAEKKPLKPLNTERRYDNWKSAMSNRRAMGVGNFEQYKMQREVNFPILFILLENIAEREREFRIRGLKEQQHIHT